MWSQAQSGLPVICKVREALPERASGGGVQQGQEAELQEEETSTLVNYNYKIYFII